MGANSTVYRIERPKDRCGPFENGHARPADDNCYRKGCGCSVYNPPGPHCDEGLRDWWRLVERVWDYRQSPYIFGFASVRQLENWFCINARRSLARNGYRIARIEGREVHYGTHQACFHKDSERVEYLPMYRKGETHD